MKITGDIAPRLAHLLAAISEIGDRHLDEVQTDLRQTAFLLAGAIDKLGQSFIGMHEAGMAQQALIASLADGASITPALRAALAALQQKSQLHADVAITALQFQDMTNQLIGRVTGHVDSLKTVLGDIRRDAGVRAADDDTVAVLATLNAVNLLLDEKNASLQDVSRRAVAQTHMESGDIELF